MRRTAGGSLNVVFKFIYGPVLIGYFAGRAPRASLRSGRVVLVASFWSRRSGRARIARACTASNLNLDLDQEVEMTLPTREGLTATN